MNIQNLIYELQAHLENPKMLAFLSEMSVNNPNIDISSKNAPVLALIVTNQIIILRSLLTILKLIYVDRTIYNSVLSDNQCPICYRIHEPTTNCK